MSDSRLSFYPEEEDVGRQYSVVEREPGQLEEIFRSCRLVSRDLFSQAQQAATTASDQAQGASIVSSAKTLVGRENQQVVSPAPKSV